MPERSNAEEEHLKARRQVAQPDSEQYDRSGDPGRTAHPALPGSTRLSGRGNTPVRASMLTAAQQTYGNRAVQRMVHSTNGTTPVQRDPNDKDPGSLRKQQEAMQMMTKLVEDMDKQILAMQGRLGGSGAATGKPKDHEESKREQKIDKNTERLRHFVADVENKGWISAISNQIVEALGTIEVKPNDNLERDYSYQELQELMRKREIMFSILSKTMQQMNETQLEALRNVR